MGHAASMSSPRAEEDGTNSGGADEKNGEQAQSTVPRRQPGDHNLRRRSFDTSATSERSRFGPKLALDDISVGDIVQVTNLPDGRNEGIVIERINRMTVRVDLGDNVYFDALVENLKMVLKFDDFEVGEVVELKPPGSALFFVGKIVQMNDDNTMDVFMEGDDPDDIEHGVKKEDCRKLMTRRDVAVSRWRKAFMTVATANEFKVSAPPTMTAATTD